MNIMDNPAGIFGTESLLLGWKAMQEHQKYASTNSYASVSNLPLFSLHGSARAIHSGPSAFVRSQTSMRAPHYNIPNQVVIDLPRKEETFLLQVVVETLLNLL